MLDPTPDTYLLACFCLLTYLLTSGGRGARGCSRATSRTPRASARSTRSAPVASSLPPWPAARRRSRRASPPRASTTAWPAAARAWSARAPRHRWRTCRRGLRLGRRGQRPAPQAKVHLWSALRTPAALREPRTRRRGQASHLAEFASRDLSLYCSNRNRNRNG